jgi:glycosyltransferase involved in cell wall biosynthesis
LAGGSERYAWECAVALRDAGATVDFLTAREKSQTPGTTRGGIRVRRRGGQLSFYPLTLGRLLWRRLRRDPYDVVIDPENGIPAFVPLVVARPTVVVLVMHHVHQQQFLTYFRRPMADLGRFLERRVMPLVYRRAPTLVVSQSTHHEMVRQLAWTRPVVLVPNGTNLPDVGDHVPPEPQRVIVLGRLAQHKRINLVIRVFARLHLERPGLRLDIVGRGPVEQQLRELVDDLGLADQVTLHGFVPDADKARLLREATLQVCASDAEGWGQVVVEAASYGVPTLARNVPGLRDSIKDGATGWLVGREDDPPDVVAADLLAGARTALAALDHSATRGRVADDCRAWARAFTWEGMHAQLVDVVVRELSRRGR